MGRAMVARLGLGLLLLALLLPTQVRSRGAGAAPGVVGMGVGVGVEERLPGAGLEPHLGPPTATRSGNRT